MDLSWRRETWGRRRKEYSKESDWFYLIFKILIKSRSAVRSNYFFDNLIFLSSDVCQLWHVTTFLHDKLDLIFRWSSKYCSIICVNYALYRLVVSISSIISAWRNVVWLLIFSLLSCSWWPDPIQKLFIKSSIFPFTMLPLLWLFIFELIFKEIFTSDHFAFFPFTFIKSSLNIKSLTLG